MNDNDNFKEVISSKKEEGKKGKLYQYDGEKFVELEINSDIKKIPVLPEVLDEIKKVRNSVSKRIGKRPELEVTASAMIAIASKLNNIDESVESYAKQHYKKLYNI